jgi:hypothetical protein
LWSQMNGMETEDFETALAKENERERDLAPRLRYARPHAYYSRGLYGELLRPYFALFAREQILCLKFDDIIRRPAELAARLHRFVGVAPRPDDAAGLDIVNPSEKGGEVMPHDVMKRLRLQYADSIRDLIGLAGNEFADWTVA